jgi:hypothetical protein
MLNSLHAFPRLPADSLGRRIGRHQLRVFAFQCLKASYQRIILSIRDYGLIGDVIQVLVPLNFFA